MIFNNQIKEILVVAAMFNSIIVIFSYSEVFRMEAIVGAFLIETIYLYYEINRIINKIWLKKHGISKCIGKDYFFIKKHKIVRLRTGEYVDVNVATYDGCPIGNYEGEIRMLHSNFKAFKESMKECETIEIKIDPRRPYRYYMCLEDVAVRRCISNNCIILDEKKSKVLFVIFINIILVLTSIYFGCVFV